MKAQDGCTVLFEGFLIKSPPEEKSKDTSRWKRRYFRLFSNKTLAYYKDKKSKNCMKKPIDLSLCSSIDAKLVFKKWDHVFSINTRHRNYYLVAEDEYVMKQWLKRICDLCSFKEDPTSCTQALISTQNGTRVTSFKAGSPSQIIPISERLSPSPSLAARPSNEAQETPPQPGHCAYMLLSANPPVIPGGKTDAGGSEIREDSVYDVLPSSQPTSRSPKRSPEIPSRTDSSYRVLSQRETTENDESRPCYDFVPPPVPAASSLDSGRQDSSNSRIISTGSVDPSACYDLVPPRQLPLPSAQANDSPTSIRSFDNFNKKIVRPVEAMDNCYDVLPPRQPATPPPRPSATPPFRHPGTPLPPQPSTPPPRRPVTPPVHETVTPPPRPEKSATLANVTSLRSVRPTNEGRVASDPMSNYDILPPPDARVDASRQSPNAVRSQLRAAPVPPMVLTTPVDNSTTNCYDVLPPLQPAAQPLPPPVPPSLPPPLPPSLPPALPPSLPPLIPPLQPPRRQSTPSLSSSFGEMYIGRPISSGSNTGDEEPTSCYDVLPPRQAVEASARLSRDLAAVEDRRSSLGATPPSGMEASVDEQGGIYDFVPPPKMAPRRSSQTSSTSSLEGRGEGATPPGGVCYDTLPPPEPAPFSLDSGTNLLEAPFPAQDGRPYSDHAAYKVSQREELASHYGLVPPTRPARTRSKQQSLKRVMSVPVANSPTLLGFSERKQKAALAKDEYVDMGGRNPVINPQLNYDYVPPVRNELSKDIQQDANYNVVPPPIPAHTNDHYVHMVEPGVPVSSLTKKVPPPPLQTYHGVETVPFVKPVYPISREPDDIYDRVPLPRSKESSPSQVRSPTRFESGIPPPFSADVSSTEAEGIYDVLPPTSIPKDSSSSPPTVDRTLKPGIQPKVISQQDVHAPETKAPPINRSLKPSLKQLDINRQIDIPEEVTESEGPKENSYVNYNPDLASIYSTVPGASNWPSIKQSKTTSGGTQYYVNTAEDVDFLNVDKNGNSKSRESVASGGSNSPDLEGRLSNEGIKYTDVCFDENNSPRKISSSTPVSDCLYTTIDHNAASAVQEARKISTGQAC